MAKLRRLRPFTEADEAEVQRQIASNPDAPEATDEQLAHPMTFADAMRRHAGRPRLANPKQQVSVRLDADVLAEAQSLGSPLAGAHERCASQGTGAETLPLIEARLVLTSRASS